MRILLWHGYLLGGTGSNVYTRMLAREWSNAGHDVTVLSQEPQPERFDLGSATAVRPDVGGLLPVFVLDRYEGYEVRRVQDCSRAELDAWVEANAAAIRASFPRMSSSRITSCSAVRSAPRRARRSPSRRTAPSSSLDARQPRALGVGRRSSRRRSGDVRRLRPHPDGPARGVGHTDQRVRGAAWCRHRRVGARATGCCPCRTARGSAPRSAEPR